MPTNNFIAKQCRRLFQLPNISAQTVGAALGLMFLCCSCSYFQNDSTTEAGFDLDKLIERQKMQQELLTEPTEDKEEVRTAAELEKLGDSFAATNINRAYIYYIKGLALEPNNRSLLHKQGRLLLAKSKFAQAEVIYSKLLNLNNRDANSLEGLGRACYGQKYLNRAEEAFRDALAINENLWQSHQFLGLIEGNRQELEKAITHFKAALTVKPNSMVLLNNLAVTYCLNGNYNDTVRLLSKVAPASKNPKVHNNLALAYYRLGRYDKALTAFKHGSKHEAVAYNNLGYAYLTDKKYQDAIQAFEKAIDLYPKFYPLAEQNLAKARREQTPNDPLGLN